MLESFADNLSRKYNLDSTSPDVLQNLLDAHIIFNTSAPTENVTEIASECVVYLNKTAAMYNHTLYSFIDSLPVGIKQYTEPGSCLRFYMSENDSYVLSSTGEIDETLSTVAHKLHYCSLTILAVLVIIVSTSTWLF